MSCADAITQRLVLETCTQQPQRVDFKGQASNTLAVQLNMK